MSRPTAAPPDPRRPGREEAKCPRRRRRGCRAERPSHHSHDDSRVVVKGFLTDDFFKEP
jgi:hypothetical protein